MAERMRLEERTAVITGAAGGIGRAIAVSLARRRCHVALADVDDSGLAVTAGLAREHGVRVSQHLIDVADRTAVAVKVENIAASRPQAGLNEADVVYEELVEGGISRFAAVFHSQDSDPVGPVRSARSTDIGVAEGSATALGSSLRRLGTGAWQPSAPATFGACNEGDAGPTPAPILTMTFAGRTTTDPALSVGFQDQLFATLVDPMRTAVPTPIAWTSDRSDVAGVDQDGVVTALGAGTAVVRATAAHGVTATFSLPTRIAVASTTAQYAGNAEFGEPADGDPSDDFIVRYEQYTTSYNHTRGTPNWVSYNLEATHFGAEDRCDCFTFDQTLPAAFTRYTTADYTGAGAFHGFGIDRGHLARSFDRTSASLDNARTFYFTNIVRQAADLNQGPWAAMENDLGDLARFSNREVYIIAGVAGSKGSVKNEGTITIPASVWKVALVVPRDHGLADIDSYDDVELIAVIMPNDPGIIHVDWTTYGTTVNAIEALSGYDLLALLPDDIEATLETGIHRVRVLVDALAGIGMLGRDARSLTVKLSAAAHQLERGNVTAGVNQLESFLNELGALVQAGRLTAADAEPLHAAAAEVIEMVSEGEES